MLGFVGRFPVVTRNSTASHSDTGSFSWPESAGLTLPRNQHALGSIAEPRPQLSVGNVERVGHVPGRVLPYRAHVQDRHVFGEGVRAGEDEPPVTTLWATMPVWLTGSLACPQGGV